MPYKTVVLEAIVEFEVDHDSRDAAISDALDQVAELSRHDIDWQVAEVS